MNDWKAPIGGSGGNGARRSFTGPNGTSGKVDYSRLPAASTSDDEGEDWIQREIKGHKVKSCSTYFASSFRFPLDRRTFARMLHGVTVSRRVIALFGDSQLYVREEKYVMCNNLVPSFI